MLINILLNQETCSHLLLILRCWKENSFCINFKQRFCLAPPLFLRKKKKNLWITQIRVNFVSWSSLGSHTFSNSDKQEAVGTWSKKEEKTGLLLTAATDRLRSNLTKQYLPCLSFANQEKLLYSVPLPLYVRRELYNPA